MPLVIPVAILAFPCLKVSDTCVCVRWHWIASLKHLSNSSGVSHRRCLSTACLPPSNWAAHLASWDLSVLKWIGLLAVHGVRNVSSAVCLFCSVKKESDAWNRNLYRQRSFRTACCEQREVQLSLGCDEQVVWDFRMYSQHTVRQGFDAEVRNNTKHKSATVML